MIFSQSWHVKPRKIVMDTALLHTLLHALRIFFCFQWRKRLLFRLLIVILLILRLTQTCVGTSAIWPVMQDAMAGQKLAGAAASWWCDQFSCLWDEGIFIGGGADYLCSNTHTYRDSWGNILQNLKVHANEVNPAAWSLSSTLETTHKNCLKQKWRELKVIFIFWSLSDNFPLKYFWQRRNINEHGGIRNEFCSGAILLTSSTFLLIFHRCISTKVYIRT